jgi:hypothetical protein
VCLIIYWHKDTELYQAMLQASADLVLCFRPGGQGSSFLAIKFGRPGLCCKNSLRQL